MIRKIRPILLAILLVVIYMPTPVVVAGQLDFLGWIEELRRDALAEGISEKTLEDALAEVELLPRVIDKDRNQLEFNISLEAYLKRLVSARRIKKGRVKLREKKELLAAIDKIYGVPPHVLVAFWGIESDFGRLTGRQPVISSLVTLAYDPRRSKFFRHELMQVLHLIEDGYLSASDMRGSWAGALGQLQFIPSTLRENGIDYDGNGRIEIWQDGGDLFASAANYLAKSGWHRGWLWGREVKLPAGLDRRLVGSVRTVPFWRDRGVTKVYGVKLPLARINATLLQPDGPGTRAFLVYKNFEAILKWNRSVSYAIAVGLLSDKLRLK